MTDTEILNNILKMLKPEHASSDKFINSLEKFRREITHYIEINRKHLENKDG